MDYCAKNENGEIWKWLKNGSVKQYKVFTSNADLKNRIKGWKGVILHDTYYSKKAKNKIIGWDLIFDSGNYNRVADLLGLPMQKKNYKRVSHGHEMAAKNQMHRFLMQ